jgi:RHS repeat-associated protein
MEILLRMQKETTERPCKVQMPIKRRKPNYGLSIRIVLIVALLLVHPAVGQSYSTSTGIPSFSTPQPVELGFVDASEGNLHLSIPIGSYQQRGASQPENITLEYDSNFWQTIYTGSISVWVPNGANAGNGWYTSFPWVFSQIASQSSGCQTDIPWSDQNGTVHYFHVATGAAIFTNDWSSKDCPGESDAFSIDSSGYHMYVWNRAPSSQSGDNGSLGFAVYAPDGTIGDSDCVGTCPAGIGVDSNNIGSFGKDPNGNYLYGLYGFTLTDTLGRQVTGGDYAGAGYAGAQAIAVPNSQGAAQYKLTWATIKVKTNFSQPYVDEFQQGYSSPWPLTVLESVTLPDEAGSTYSFKYDCDQTDSANTPGACSSPGGQSSYYGVITGITLPTGGTETYSYQTFQDAYGGKSLWVSSHSSASGTWSYSGPQVLSTCTVAQPINCQQKSTVASPTGTTEYTYRLNNGAWPITVVQKDLSGTVLSTVANTFDFTQACVTIKCQGNAFVRLTNQTTTIPSTGGNLKKQTSYAYDSPQYGNKTAVQEWGYIPSANAFASVPDRATYMSYLNYNSVPGYTTANTATISGGSNINRPTKVTRCNNTGNDSDCPGGGSNVSQTIYTYDIYGSGGLAAVSGATQHDDNNFGVSNTVRGNPTSIAQWVSGSTYLTTSYTYDTTGQVLTMTDPAKNITTYGYADSYFTDSGNGSAPAPYTPPQPTNAYVTSVTDAIGTQTMGYYWGGGKTAIVTDYNNVSASNHYQDGLDRQTEEVDPIGWSVATYPSATQADMYTAVADTAPSMACVSCQHTQTILDIWGRTAFQVLVNNPIGPVEVDSSYDTAGRLQTQSHPYSGTGDPNHVSETISYDALNRQISTTHPDGQSQQSAYGPNVGSLGGLSSQQGPTATYGYGYPQVSEDESGNERQQWLDGFGRIIEVDEPSSSAGLTSSPLVTNYLYDAGDRITKVIQGAQIRTFAYDGLGRKISETTPEGGTVTYVYLTSSGVVCSGVPSSVCQRTDARGVVSIYTYDHANRLTGVAYTIPGGKNIASMANACTTTPNSTAANTCYYYGQGGAAAYALGRLTEMVDPSGSESYNHDANGRVTTLSKVINGKIYNVGYQYDAGGDLTQITYPSGRVVQQAYTQTGQLCQIAPTAANCTAASSYYAANFSYNAPGNLLGLNYGNGVTGTFLYSPDRMQLAYLAYTKGTSTYFNLQYSYEQQSQYSPSCPLGTSKNNGSIQCITDNVDMGRSVGYGYDPLKRMNSANSCGSSNFPKWGLAENFDRFGNRWTQTVTAGSGPSSDLSFGSSGMNSSTTNQPNGYTFDLSGNMTVEPLPAPNSMTYDGENRMAAFSGSGGTAAYTYDGNGLRIVKSVSAGTTTVSIYSGSSVLAEYDNGAAPTAPSREYIYNPAGGETTGLLAMISGSATTYYHQDHLSVRLTTDGTIGSPTYGQVLSQEGHLPFGEPWYQSGTGNNWLFTSYNRDSESGLDYALARYYDSRTGTFCSADPLAGSPGDPQSWNRYPYGRNDPIDITDPSGKSWWSSLLIDIGIGVGVALLPEIAPEWFSAASTGSTLLSSDGFYGGFSGTTFWAIPSSAASSPSLWSTVLAGAADGAGIAAASNSPQKSPAPSNFPPQPNPCLVAGNAPDPSYYAQKGQAAASNPVKDFLNLFNFRRGGALDAQVGRGLNGQPFGGAPSYANYTFGVYMAAAGYTLNQTLAGADIYAQYRSRYPAGTKMAGPNYPFTPQTNVNNITKGFNAQMNGTPCHKPG